MIHVALIEPEIPWNSGNAGRTCLAFGAQLHLVGPLGFSLDDKQVRRAGLDYWKHVAPVVHEDFETFANALPSLGTAFFLSADAGRTLPDTDLPGDGEDAVFVFGRESVGFSAHIRERYADRLVRIPQRDGRVRSINLSTCVGIVLYEAARQRTSGNF